MSKSLFVISVQFFGLLLIACFTGSAFAQSGATNAYGVRSTATYQMTFTSTWSQGTHPDDFPDDAHYSPLIGATHAVAGLIWSPDSLASPGIESMAETGGTSTLSGEIEMYKSAGSAQFQIDGPGLNTSPDVATLSFDVTTAQPLVSIVTMVAPSPDWFVGVNSLNLFDGGAWIDSVTVTAYAYDSGSDDGTSYTAEDIEADPHQPVFRIEETPFKVNDTVVPLGEFTFTLVSVLGREDPGHNESLVRAPYPNPFRNTTTIGLQASAPSKAELTLYDILGRKIRTPFSGTVGVDGVDVVIDGSSLAPGIYLYQVKIGENAQSGTIVLSR